MASPHDELYQEYLKMSILGGNNTVYPSQPIGGVSGLAGLPPYSQQPAVGPWGLQPTYSKHSAGNMRAALAIRMGWNVDQTGQYYFEYCEPRKLNEDKAVVFVIHDGKALAVEDDLNLFPSDALVTQLRLLQGTK